MPERKDLYDRISTHIWEDCENSVSGKPVDWITEALLWRGFLVEKRPAEILLCTGSHKDDIKLLEEIFQGTGFHVQEILKNDYHLATISVPQRITESDIYKIVSSGQQPGHGLLFEPLIGVGRKSFEATKFGACVEVRWLDIGIALLVKTLPLARVLTNYSRDGFCHGDHYPQVGLHGELHFDWCKKVVDEVASQLGIAKIGKFIADPQKSFGYRWQITSAGFDRQIEEAFQVFHKIHRVAQHLMHPEVLNQLQYLIK